LDLPDCCGCPTLQCSLIFQSSSVDLKICLFLAKLHALGIAAFTKDCIALCIGYTSVVFASFHNDDQSRLSCCVWNQFRSPTIAPLSSNADMLAKVGRSHKMKVSASKLGAIIFLVLVFPPRRSTIESDLRNLVTKPFKV